MPQKTTSADIDARLEKIRSATDYQAYIALALMGESVPRERWRTVLRDAGITHNGSAYTRAILDELIESAATDSAILVDGTRVEIVAELTERLARDFPSLEIPSLTKKVLLNLFAGSSYYPGAMLINFKGYDEAVCGLRLAIVSEDADLINTCYEKAQNYNRNRWQQQRPLQKILANPTADGWLNSQPEYLADWLLTSLRVHDVQHLAGSEEWQAAAEQFVNRTGSGSSTRLYSLLWESALLSGDNSKLDSLEALMPPWQRLACDGSRLVVQGELKAAADCFDQGLKLLRKTTGKRTAFFEDVNGLFYLLLLTFSADAADNKKLARLRKQAEKVLRPELMNNLSLLEFAEDQRAGDEVDIELRQWFDQRHWFTRLMAVLLNHWFELGEASLCNELKQLAVAENLLWLQSELSALSGSGSKTDKNNGGFTLHELYRPQQPWERKLEGLRLLGGSAATKSDTAANSQDGRLVWLLHWNDHNNAVRIDVKEQRRTAKGWTKGRAVALKRLVENEVDCMDEPDQRAATSIELVSERNGWGHQDSYRFRYSQLLAGLVGHPRLFFADNPLLAVDLVLREPALLVKKSKKRLKVVLDPEPEVYFQDVSRWLLNSAGGNRVEFVPFSKEHLQIDELLGDGGLELPIDAEEKLLAAIQSIAPMIDVHSDIGGGSGSSTSQVVETAKTLFLFISPLAAGLHLHLAACPLGADGPRLKPCQGVANVMSLVGGEQRETQRNLKVEKKQLQALLTEWPGLQENEGYNATLEDLQDCLQLLETLPQLSDSVTPVWPEGESFRLSKQLDSNSLKVTVSSQQDWFALDGEIQVSDDVVLGMSQLLELTRETSGRFLPLGNGQYLNLTTQLRKQLQQLADVSATQGKKQRLNRYAIAQLDGIEDAVGQFKAPQKWARQAQRLRLAMASEPALPSTFEAELRDYQLEGYRWLMRLAGWGAGACLADDMGLGKTLQALAALLAHAPDGPSLVVAPTSVAGNWLAEAQRFTPTLKLFRVFSGAQLEKLPTLGAFDVIITSYGIMQQGVESLSKQSWQMLVLDEAQSVKNAATKRAKAAREIPANFRVVLTGTPVENHLGDLWSLFAISNPGLLGSAEQFNKRYLKPIAEQNNDAARQALRRLIQPFILRRTKQAVLQELPPRTEINLRVELDEPERALYEAQRREALARLDGSDAAKQAGHRQLQILAEITRLRRACCHPTLVMPNSKLPGAKLQQLLSVVTELRDNNHRALVFSQFVDHLSIIRQALDKAGISYQYIDGSTPAKKRDAAVKAFQSGEGDLFLISLKAGGFGLNLTAADYVIHMDPWWNPAVEDQASDRAHRMGQTRPVTIYRLITSNTIEEKIVALHQQKRGLADSLLAGTDQGAKLNAEAVLALLREV